MVDDDNDDNDVDDDDEGGFIGGSAMIEDSSIIIRQPFSWRSKYTRASTPKRTQAHSQLCHLSPCSFDSPEHLYYAKPTQHSKTRPETRISRTKPLNFNLFSPNNFGLPYPKIQFRLKNSP